MNWRVFRKETTQSTNLDAAAGAPGDVFTAAVQTAGRGRLDHKWHSAPGENLLMSAVVSAEGVAPEEAATLPLVAGLAAARAVRRLSGAEALVKWPNDVLVGGRKICGILCEKKGDNVIVGIGMNVLEREFPPDIAAGTASLSLLGAAASVEDALSAVLEELSAALSAWRAHGFENGIWPEIAKIDFLKGKETEVFATDGDAETRRGECGGIASDGSLLVAGISVWAGEARVRPARRRFVV